MPMTRPWKVLRDKAGNPITVTEEQCAAIRHAGQVWLDVVQTEHERGIKVATPVEAVSKVVEALNSATFMKSCLMGRMLYQGRDPLPEAPPVIHSAPAYYLTDPDLCHVCGGEIRMPGKKLTIRMNPDYSVTYTVCIQPCHSDDYLA
jgi:hypothetical protein